MSVKRPLFIALLCGVVTTLPANADHKPTGHCLRVSLLGGVDSWGRRGGELTLRFGLRSHRQTDSGETRLMHTPWEARYRATSPPEEWATAGGVSAGAVLSGRSVAMAVDRPERGAPVKTLLYERIGRGGHWHVEWHTHEGLVLWPVPEDQASDRLRFIDLLTDTDGDGVGDVNERLAGTQAGIECWGNCGRYTPSGDEAGQGGGKDKDSRK